MSVVSMWERYKTKVANVMARRVSTYASNDTLIRIWSQLQHMHLVFLELEEALWHFLSLPSRSDVQAALRQVASVRRRLVELDRQIDKLFDAGPGE